MKKCLVISVLLLLASLPGISAPKAGSNTQSSSHAQPSRFSQFRVNRSPKPHGPAKAVAHPHGIPVRLRSTPQTSAPWRRTSETEARPSSYTGRAHRLASSSSPAVSFVAAARTLLGGEDDDETQAVMGDFNGDGVPDVAKVVTNVVATVSTYQISVMLGNGDGTFKPAVLTTTDSNTDDPIIVGDLTGSGTDDIIQVHPQGADSCDRPQPNAIHPKPLTGVPSCVSSFDVMLSNGSGGFAAPVNYTISDLSLNGGLLTDVNGDGKLDLLVFDNSTPADVIVMLGVGDGTFGNATTPGHLTTSAPNNMIFADFNGDGNIDFAGQVEGRLQVTLASGAGLYANAPVPLVTPDGNYGACNSITGNLTSAKVPEIVSFNCEQNTVTVYVNNGDGTFATGLYYDNNGDRDQDIADGAIADMNGDGKNDIVAINESTAEISVFLGNGDGTVAVQPLRYGVGGYAWTPPLVADFNSDGLMDVVESDDEFNLVYLQGYGEGSFKAAPTYSLPNSFNQDAYTYSVATGDFNGDGIPDVAVGQDRNYGSTGVTIYLGKGDGTFLTGVSYGPSSDMGELAVGDFNGDGNLDIAALDLDSGQVQIFLGNGDGTFRIGAMLPTGGDDDGPSDLVVGDFNQDGKLDIAVSNYDGNVGVLLGNGNGTFAPVVNYSVGEGLGAVAIAAGDANGDGLLDLEVACGSDEQPAVVIMLGSSSTPGTFGAPTPINLNGEPNYITVGDLRNDGKLDMAVTESDGLTYNGQVEVFLGSGTGTFATAVAYPASTFGGASARIDPANIQMADLTGSGNLGLVYLNSDFGTLAVATGNGDGTLNPPVEFPTSEDVWGMALVDLTGDGSMDVLTGEDDGGGFDVLINGNGSAANPNYSLGTPTPAASVTAGSTATYMVTLSGTNGYSGTVTFTCGNLPAGATCTFSPASVVANGSVPLTTTLTVSTTASSSAELLRPALPGSKSGSKSGSTLLLASLSGIGLFGMFLAGSGKKRNVRILTGMMVLLLFGTLAACSGTSSGSKATTGTPAGTYVVAVTSTGTGTGSPSHTLNLTLVVQ